MLLEDEIKGHFRNEYHKGFINLSYTTKHLGYEFYKSLKLHNITEQQYNVLRILRGFQSHAPLSISFIKDRMLDKKSDVSRLVDRLLDRKLISRVENSLDRRQKSVDITDDGLRLLTAMLDCEKKIDTLLLPLTIDEVRQLNYLLDKIRC